MKLNRRNFLKSSAHVLALGSPVSFFPGLLDLARAQAGMNGDHLFLHIQIEGGADMAQSLDPMVNIKAPKEEYFVDYNYDTEVIKTPGFLLGPAAKSLVPFASDIALIRGIWMPRGNSSSHEFCRLYMATGQNNIGQDKVKGTTVAAAVADASGMGPRGILTNSTREWANAINPNLKTTLVDDLGGKNQADEEQSFLKLFSTDTGDTIPGKALREFTDGFDTLQTHQNYLDGMSAKLKKPTSAFDLEEKTVASFGSGLARQFHLNLGGDFAGPGPKLDHHSGYELGSGSGFQKHLTAQEWYWRSVAKILKLMKELPYQNTNDSILSRTTVLVTNEFSRSAAIDEGSGKNHNPSTNTALLAGRGIRGGTAAGATIFASKAEAFMGLSNSQLYGALYDFNGQKSILKADMPSTGQGRLIRPENVIVTVARACGISPSLFKTVRMDQVPPVTAILS